MSDENNVLVKMIEHYQQLLTQGVKLNEMSIANLEALIQFQMNSSVSRLQSYMSLAKSAADIHDMQSYRDFIAQQADTSVTLHHKFSDDTKALTELFAQFQGDFGKLMHDTLTGTEKK